MLPFRPIVSPVAAGLVTLLALLTPAISETPPPSSASQGVPVAVAPAEKRDLPIYVRGIGTVEAWRSVNMRAEVTGYLQSINFKEGQEVKQGDLLAMIDPRPYAAALAQAAAKKAGDAANLANDRINQQRDAALARSDFASRQQVDNDTALVRQFEANVQADDAAIQAAQLNLEFCRITAPFDGVVGFLLVGSAFAAIVTGPRLLKVMTAWSASGWSISAIWCRPTARSRS